MRRGYSLVETILSFFLMTLVLLVVVNLFPGNLRATRNAELSLQAQAVADEALEQARAGGFSRLVKGTQSPVESIKNGTSYMRVLEVAEIPGQNFANLKSLKVRVTWKFSSRPLELVREVWVSNVRS